MHYEVLGIIPYATEREIRKAYHARARIFHPDKTVGGDDEFKARKTEVFKGIVRAYEVLIDSDLRRNYDIIMGYVR
jgi:DnaJ-class molecular chaperone